MYLAHFGLSEPPFRITPHTEFFFEGANRGATLEALIYAVTHDEGIVKVTGEVGSGKTMLCRVLLERLPPPVVTIYLANPSLGRDEILLTIAEELKVDTSGKRTTVLLRALQDALIQLYAQGNRVIVLIDEAHAMPAETLEEIRLLSNLESNRHKLLQIILFGQPELEEHLNLPNMRQLRERITHSFRLEPLVRSDIDNYIDFRMRAAGYKGPNVFARPALKIIARASEGLTRRINILADKSLLAAFADNSHQVTPKHAKAAVDDSGFRRMRRVRPGWWVAAGTLALGLALGVAIQYVVAPRVNGPASSPAAPPAAVPAATPASAPASPSAPAPGTGSSANKDGTALTVQPPGPSTGQAGGIGAGGVPAGEPAGGKMQLTPSNLQTNAANSGQVARAAMGTSSAAAIPSGERGADAERAEQADRPAATAGTPRMPPPSGLASSTAPAAAASPAAGAAANPSSPASGAPVIAARMAATSSAAAPANGRDASSPISHPVAAPRSPAPAPREGPAPMGGPFKSIYAQERYAAARSWMAAAPSEAFTIQLMTASDSDIEWVENFLARAQQLANSDQVYVYSWPFDGRAGYRVAYGLYDTVWACRDAIAELPESLRRYQPYPERIAVVRKLSGGPGAGMAQQ